MSFNDQKVRVFEGVFACNLHHYPKVAGHEACLDSADEAWAGIH